MKPGKSGQAAGAFRIGTEPDAVSAIVEDIAQ